MNTKLLLPILLCLFYISYFTIAPSHAADEETKRLLLEIKGELKTISVELKATNQRIDELDKRLTTEIRATNQRIDELDRRLTTEIRATNQRIVDTNQRINDLYTAIGYLTAAVTAILIASIGFAYWDRKTAIQQSKKETIAEIEAIGRLRDVISTLQELAKRDAHLEGLLRQFHLL